MNIIRKPRLVDEIRRVIRTSIGNRAKESLIIDFINDTEFYNIEDKASVIDAFLIYAQSKQKEEAVSPIEDEKPK